MGLMKSGRGKLKILVGSCLLFLMPLSGRAEVTDLIQSTLLDHVSTVTQFKSGETKVALMDSVVLIGSYKGHSLLDLQLGLSGETNPEAGEPTGGNFVYGVFFKVSSLLKDRVNFPEHWRFLNSIEHGIAYQYDTREKRDSLSYQVGLAFGLNPQP